MKLFSALDVLTAFNDSKFEIVKFTMFDDGCFKIELIHCVNNGDRFTIDLVNNNVSFDNYISFHALKELSSVLSKLEDAVLW